MLQEPYYNSDGSQFLQILPHVVDNKKYQHLAKVVPKLGSNFLTEGAMVVTQVLTWYNNKVYFVGTKENDPGSRHLYVYDGSSSRCVTCDLPMANDTTKICEYSDFYLSPNTEYFVQVSISSTFYEQLLRQYSCTKNFLCLQFGFVIFWRTNIGAKGACKMLMKLTPDWGDLTNHLAQRSNARAGAQR